jgi:class 3 adenylate cyclase
LDEIEQFLTGRRGGREHSERVLATVLFTDIVGSTERAAALGDAHWRDLLDRHDEVVRVQIERFGGRAVKTTGDGFLATFDSPSRAVRAAVAIRAVTAAVGLEIRAGLHAGEVERRADDVAGLAVHVGARVAALAQPSEVLVSSTVRDLVLGSEFRFYDRGRHRIKGIDGEWQLSGVTG